MQFSEPKRFIEEDSSFLYSHDRSITTQNGLLAMPTNLKIVKIVSIESEENLFDQIQQDYYLNKILKTKFQVISTDKEVMARTQHFVEIYLSYAHLEDTHSKKIKAYALSNLTLV